MVVPFDGDVAPILFADTRPILVVFTQEGKGTSEAELRSEVNIELNFPPKLRGARSRLHRRRFLQVNTRWKALAEIYTMHSFAPFSNLNFFVKNRQNFFAIELMNIH